MVAPRVIAGSFGRPLSAANAQPSAMEFTKAARTRVSSLSSAPAEACAPDSAPGVLTGRPFNAAESEMASVQLSH